MSDLIEVNLVTRLLSDNQWLKEMLYVRFDRDNYFTEIVVR
jgi:hypothetical protein